MSNPTSSHLYKQITRWFHESGAIDSVTHIFNRFIHYTSHQQLQLIMPKDRIWKFLCSATCALRKDYLLGRRRILLHNYSFYRPRDWKEEYEDYWNLILEDLFSNDITDSLFSPIPVDAWEHDVRNWREVIGCFLPDVIHPTFELLEQFGYVVRDNNDEWIPYEENEWNED